MSGQTEPPPTLLTDLHRARIDYAHRDLDYARAEDLAQLPAAGLILLVEKLRGRLGDMLDLIDELGGKGTPDEHSTGVLP